MDKICDTKRNEILEFIIGYIETHGYGPSIREIRDGAHLQSNSSVHRHLHKMMEMGMIETDAGQGSSRAIRVPRCKFVRENG